ncbi:MAG: PAAR domain-containing protein [Anaerolineales bacterium]|nr:PAAR domain-containing protein [Anaerolineales bacterium]
MGFPAARLGDMTVTGDAITGPGVPTVLIMGQPAAVVGDLVSGAACVGSIVMGSTTVLIMGRPAARTMDPVAGANPVTGVPVSTTIAPTPAAMVLIGP